MYAGNAPLPTLWLARVAALLSAMGWVWLLLGSHGPTLPAFCGSVASGLNWRNGGFGALLLLNPPMPAASVWFAMLLAMMPMLLLQPAAYVWRQSLRRHRWALIATFTAGYFVVWMLAGLMLTTTAVLLLLVADVLGVNAAMAAFAAALLWQASPARQHAYNRCHRQSRMSAFGWRAWRDAFVFGTRHALPCLAVCGPWMLVSLLAGPAHLAVMASVCVVLALERDQPARPAMWRWPFETLFSRKSQPAHAGLIVARRQHSRSR
jgi:predicted metal-binding membrane protein